MGKTSARRAKKKAGRYEGDSNPASTATPRTPRRRRRSKRLQPVEPAALTKKYPGQRRSRSRSSTPPSSTSLQSWLESAEEDVPESPCPSSPTNGPVAPLLFLDEESIVESMTEASSDSFPDDTSDLLSVASSRSPSPCSKASRAGSPLDSRSITPASCAALVEDDSDDEDDTTNFRSLSPASFAARLREISHASTPSLTHATDEGTITEDEAVPTTPSNKRKRKETEKPKPIYDIPDVPFDVPAPIRGYHISSDGGIVELARRYLRLKESLAWPNDIGVQFFYGNPRKAPTIVRVKEIEDFAGKLQGTDFKHWTLHGSHATNLASPHKETRENSYLAVKREMEKCNLLGVRTYCVHLGTFQERGADGRWCADTEAAIARVVEQVKRLLKAVPGVKIAFENMVRDNPSERCAHDKNWSLRQLKRVVDGVGDKRAMVCVDICHAFISDHDLRDLRGVQALQADLAAIGYDRVACMHVSDSSMPHGRRCEGHVNIGDGLIPMFAFRNILRHPGLLGKVPYYLETPYYMPSPRPKDSDAKYWLELQLKKIEWDALEYIIRVPDAVWREQVGVDRFRKAKDVGDSARSSIRSLLRRYEKEPGARARVLQQNDAFITLQKTRRQSVKREREAWLRTVRESTQSDRSQDGDSEEDWAAQQAYEKCIQETIKATQWATTRQRSTDAALALQQAMELKLASDADKPREASRRARNVYAPPPVPDSDPFEPPDEDSDGDFRPTKTAKKAIRRQQKSGVQTRLSERMIARTQSAPALRGGGAFDGVVIPLPSIRSRQPRRSLSPQ